MANEDRIAALRGRIHRPGEEVKDMTTVEAVRPAQPAQPIQEEKRQYSNRSRHTLYLDKSLIKRIDQAFKRKRSQLNLQGIDIEKADFLEAILVYGLVHEDKANWDKYHP